VGGSVYFKGVGLHMLWLEAVKVDLNLYQHLCKKNLISHRFTHSFGNSVEQSPFWNVNVCLSWNLPNCLDRTRKFMAIKRSVALISIVSHIIPFRIPAPYFFNSHFHPSMPYSSKLSLSCRVSDQTFISIFFPSCVYCTPYLSHPRHLILLIIFGSSKIQNLFNFSVSQLPVFFPS
jgi:hypothetical protein